MSYLYYLFCHRSSTISIPTPGISHGLFKLKVIYCVGGVITPPCGVPWSFPKYLFLPSSPSSTTGAFSHIRINRRMFLSVTRLATCPSSLSWGRVSKEATTYYPPRGFPLESNYSS
jgi:hypothetical protein